jgi:hypothetical protein
MTPARKGTVRYHGVAARRALRAGVSVAGWASVAASSNGYSLPHFGQKRSAASCGSPQNGQSRVARIVSTVPAAPRRQWWLKPA